jgi:hypothetical protein
VPRSANAATPSISTTMTDGVALGVTVVRVGNLIPR